MTRLKSGKAHKISLDVKYESTFEVELRLPRGKSLNDISELWVEWDDLCFTIGDREYRQRVNPLSPIFTSRWPESVAAYNKSKSWYIEDGWDAIEQSED